MRKTLFVLAIPAALLFALIVGFSLSQAQFHDFGEPDPVRQGHAGVGLPSDNDEGDDECDDYPAPVPKTGQTLTYWTGDDGDLRTGIEWPSPRFIDNLNGTVTDLLTGLVWLQDATRFSASAWNPALNRCNNLADDGVDLTDGSQPGDWRLPNNRELRSLVDFGNTNPALPTGHPFTVPASGAVWTSTTATNNTGRAWTIEDGTMINDPKNTPNWVWPVRDGDGIGLAPAPVPKTGQTIPYGDRDDGELQKGVEWPDPRFTDNMDGTVKDELTGLVWLADAERLGSLTFEDALGACNTLADDGMMLTDGSMPGDWRLPNIWELGSLNDFSQIGPALPVGHPFTVSNAGTFWSSTTWDQNANRAWALGLGIGRITHLPKGGLNLAWPVRGCDCDDEGDDDVYDGDDWGSFGSGSWPDTADPGGGMQHFTVTPPHNGPVYGTTAAGPLDRQQARRSLGAGSPIRSVSDKR